MNIKHHHKKDDHIETALAYITKGYRKIFRAKCPHCKEDQEVKGKNVKSKCKFCPKTFLTV